MKDSIYTAIAIIILFITLMYLFSEWTDYQFLKADSCWHRDIIKATKTEVGFHPKNEIGEDTSCYVDFVHNGKKGRSEYWNVGNCDGSEIDISIIDYNCH